MKPLLHQLGFQPKDNAQKILIKQYPDSGYMIEVDFEKQVVNYGELIEAGRETTQNFSQEENWVVLECVDRLLEKGYRPEDIVLEQKFTVGHGASGGWLDVLVKKDGQTFLMIECKMWGREFEKEFARLNKDGGQLFTYFQQDTRADYLVLYTSRLHGDEVEYRTEIVKIEDHYRDAGNVEDVYNRWNKQTKQNGIFEEWVAAYGFESTALTLGQLEDIRQEDAQRIFNRFAEILRKHVVSDKPNAFNKIFNLFLCKICDEYRIKDDQDETWFQWKDNDTHESFQNRLNRLYREGMKIFLGKDIVDFDEEDLKVKYPKIASNEEQRRYFMEILNELRLKKSNEFAIKEVYDDRTFEENGKVLKECVELLQQYKIRYDKRHPYLSDFFELLLTTGLKQESGQFFTPVPVARYIIKCLPIRELFSQKIQVGNFNDLLPSAIDYAAGSGHFLHEFMHEVQDIIDGETGVDCTLDVKNELESWKIVKFKWAKEYVYGVEKDYRLAKVGKVGCYLHGDGLAQVIHGDGLDNFYRSDDYTGFLSRKGKGVCPDPRENPVFDVVIANPPYSVANFKANIKNVVAHGNTDESSFELYEHLSDQSDEIECLFIERTKQLLKDGGVAGIILPSSILSNGGIYTRTRELLLKYFEVIGITELGSGTFMATGTNTVVLFLRRRNNYDWKNIASSIETFFVNYRDITVNGNENPFSKYVAHVWESLKFSDYVTLCQKQPNEVVQQHEMFQEYSKKLKHKGIDDLCNQIVEREKEKLLYFILASAQQVVVTKSGQKQDEKNFLGYEFSFRRGHEGIHAIQRGKSIDDCTKLYNPTTQTAPDKASYYVYQNFLNTSLDEVPETLQQHITTTSLVDMMTFDRVDFEKTVSLSVKKKMNFESKWELVKLGAVCEIVKGVTYSKEEQSSEKTSKIILTADNITLEGKFELKKQIFLNEDFDIDKTKKLKKDDIFICFSSGSKQHLGKVAFIREENSYYAGGFMGIIRSKGMTKTGYVYQLLNTSYRSLIIDSGSGSNINNLSNVIKEIKIPLPPLNIQQKIVSEIEGLEKESEEKRARVEVLRGEIEALFESGHENTTSYRLSDSDMFEITIGKRVLRRDLKPEAKIPVYSANVFEPFGYVEKLLIKDFSIPSILWGIDGDWMVNFIPAETPFYPTDHCGVLRVKVKDIQPRYLAHVLHKEGVALEFSRHKRASIDRIEGIKVSLPPLPEQQRIVEQIEKIEQEIETLQTEIAASDQKKEAVLKKYL